MIKNIFTPFLFTLLLSVGFTAPVQARAAIDLIDLDVQTISISIVGNVLHVVGAENEQLAIYNVTGVRVMSVKLTVTTSTIRSTSRRDATSSRWVT